MTRTPMHDDQWRALLLKHGITQQRARVRRREENRRRRAEQEAKP